MNISKEKKKAEALSRMRELGIYEYAIKQFDELDKISISEPPVGAFFWIKGEDLEQVKKFEQEYNALVFVVIRSYTTDGLLDSFLFVSDYSEDWADERQALKNCEATAYVYNHDAPYCSEVGIIGIELTAAAGLSRNW